MTRFFEGAPYRRTDQSGSVQLSYPQEVLHLTYRLVINLIALGFLSQITLQTSLAEDLGSKTDKTKTVDHYWTFDRVDYFYEGKGSLYIAIQIGKSKYLFAPEYNKILRLKEISMQDLNEVWSPISGSPISIKDNEVLEVDNPGPGSCSEAGYTDPPLLQLKLRGKLLTAFYILAKNTPPESFVVPENDSADCYSAFAEGKEFSRIFGSPVLGNVFPLKNGEIVLAGFYRHLVVDLAGIPSHPISFADSLFFLPEARLHKDLDAAGRNVAARYAVFVKAIHECKAAQLYHAGD